MVGFRKDSKLTADKATLLCSLTSRTPPPPLRSLPYKSHDPSFNYLTTQAGRRENLKTSAVSLIGA